MLMAVVGLAIPTVVSVVGALTGGKRAGIKTTLIVCAAVGFGLGIYSAVNARSQAALAQRQAEDVSDQLKAANDKLKSQEPLLRLINVTTGDLAALNRLSGGDTYYVRIAADTSSQRLEPFLARICQQFKGAEDSGLVKIREPRPGSHNYELVFGNHLDVAAAEVFQRLATSHGFHPGQVIEILPEWDTK